MVAAILHLPRPPRVEKFFAARPIERVHSLPVRNYGPGTGYDTPVRHRFAEVRLPACAPGDLLSIDFAMQATSELAYYVELSGRLVLTRSATGIDGLSLTGRGGRGYNIDPEMHHAPLDFSTQHMLAEGGDWYLIAMIYAGGSSLSRPGDSIVVDVGYGDFTVTRTRH